MAGPVKAYNWVQGTAAAVVGPARSRLRQIVIYAAAAGAFTIKNGSASGETLITQTFPTGIHHLNIPDDGLVTSPSSDVTRPSKLLMSVVCWFRSAVFPAKFTTVLSCFVMVSVSFATDASFK